MFKWVSVAFIIFVTILVIFIHNATFASAQVPMVTTTVDLKITVPPEGIDTFSFRGELLPGQARNPKDINCNGILDFDDEIKLHQIRIGVIPPFECSIYLKYIGHIIDIRMPDYGQTTSSFNGRTFEITGIDTNNLLDGNTGDTFFVEIDLRVSRSAINTIYMYSDSLTDDSRNTLPSITSWKVFRQ